MFVFVFLFFSFEDLWERDTVTLIHVFKLVRAPTTVFFTSLPALLACLPAGLPASACLPSHLLAHLLPLRLCACLLHQDRDFWDKDSKFPALTVLLALTWKRPQPLRCSVVREPKAQKFFSMHRTVILGVSRRFPFSRLRWRSPFGARPSGNLEPENFSTDCVASFDVEATTAPSGLGREGT